jgi:hypothetical protein
MSTHDRAVAIAALVVLSAIAAELLAAYSDSTGRPLELLFSVAFFAALYGCPALLIREFARRTNRGWLAMFVLSAAAGLLQAGVIDQSLFAERYGDVRGWEESVRATYVAPLGVSAYMAQNFVLGHVAFSFCAPIALAETIRPAIAHRPWLRRRGRVIAAGLWLLVATMILLDERHATPAEALAALAAVAILIAAARHAQRGTRRTWTPRVHSALIAAFLFAAAHSAAPETWVGTAFAVAVALAGGFLLARAATGGRWALEHAAAVATGVLLARGALAFLYYPLVGETSAAPKYAHNTVMLAVVAGVGAYAIRSAHRRSYNGSILSSS